MSGSSSEALGASGLWKRFGELVANRDVSISIPRGEVHAVIGENGAGKSTLMRALYGMAPPDEGEVRLFGERIPRPSVTEAIARRVGMVHQHFMLIPTLTVVENVVLGREPVRRGLLELTETARALGEMALRYGLADDAARWPLRRVAELGVGEAQRVEIMKVLWRGAEVLILDEPTAVLSPPEVEQLFTVLRGLRAEGKTIVIVTHKLDEVMALCDRATVMRRGAVVETVEIAGTSPAALARAMVGHDLSPPGERPAPAADAPSRLEVEGLTVVRPDGTIALDQVALAVRSGEILGIAGVEGNGQRELGLAVAGLERPRAGRILLDGVDVSGETVAGRRRRGIGHVPEDRHAHGLVLSFSVEENLLLGREHRYARSLGLDHERLRSDAERIIERLDVRPADPRAVVGTMSGGNQQKVVIGRELEERPLALVCAQPTRGVDVGAAARIYEELLAFRAAGRAVLLISAELDELLLLADRIAVLYRGRVVEVVDNVPGRRATRAGLGSLMLGAGAA